MALLTRDQIIAADDFETVDVAVPEWGGTVRIKSLTGAQRDEFEESLKDKKTKEVNYSNYRAKLLSLVIIDESGKRLFETAREVTILGTKSVKALQRVFNAATELNGISDQDVEEMTEDFGEEATEGSTSG